MYSVLAALGNRSLGVMYEKTQGEAARTRAVVVTLAIVAV